jgi:hypothetical protein
MTKRLIGRLLLSLVLLWSQQMAMAHNISHLLQASSVTPEVAGKPSKPLVKHQTCADCLAYAQFFSALGSALRTVAAAEPSKLRLTVPVTPENCIVTECMFQSRAPPQA